MSDRAIGCQAPTSRHTTGGGAFTSSTIGDNRAPQATGHRDNTLAKGDSARSRGAAEKGNPKHTVALTSNHTKGGAAALNPGKSGSGAPRAAR